MCIWDVFFFSSRRRHTRLQGDWSSDVCSSDLGPTRARFAQSTTLQPGLVRGTCRPGINARLSRSEERRVGKSVDLGGSRDIKKKKEIAKRRNEYTQHKYNE